MNSYIFLKQLFPIMRNLFIPLLLSFFYSQTVNAKIVWVASKNHYQIYLIPSIHAAIEPMKWSSKNFDFLAKQNGNVYFESSNNLTNEKSLRFFQTKQNLYEIINKDTINYLEKYIIDNKLPKDYFFKLYPHVAFFELDASRRAINGVKEEYGLDYYLKNLFKDNNFKIYGLESVNDIYTTIQNVPFTESSKALNKYAKVSNQDIINDEKNIAKIINDGNINFLEKYCLNLQKNEFGNIFSKFVFQNRNKYLLSSFDSLNPPSNSIVILGAAHFFGKENILFLLRSKGFKIKQMKGD